MALTGGYLSKKMNNDDNTHGFGNHFSMRTSIWLREGPSYRQEISNIQNCAFNICPTRNVSIQGSDHGSVFRSGPVYGNYEIFVSKDAPRFPIGKKR